MPGQSICRDHAAPSLLAYRVQGSCQKFEPTESNTLIAYATKAGATADDGRGEHSPFTTALLNNLSVPGLDVRFAIGQVVDEVKKMTGNRQEPFWYGSLGGEAIALVPPKPQPKPVEQSKLLSAEVRLDYELAKEIGTKDAWDAFLNTYKTGFYVDLAKAQLAKLTATEREAEQAAALQRAEEERRAKAAAEAERQKAEQQAALQRAEEERRAKAAAEVERQKAEQQAAQQRAEEERRAKGAAEAERTKPADLPPQIAMLDPQAGSRPTATPVPLGEGVLIEDIKKELKRVGCYSGKLDDKWPGADMKSAIEKFAKYAKLASVPNEPEVDFLDAIRGNSDRVCPLECDARQLESDGRCIAKTCSSGQRLNAQGNCVAKPTAMLHPSKPVTPQAAESPDRYVGQIKLPKSVDIPPENIKNISTAGEQTCGPNGCQIVPKGCVAIRRLHRPPGATGPRLGGKIFC